MKYYTSWEQADGTVVVTKFEAIDDLAACASAIELFKAAVIKGAVSNFRIAYDNDASDVEVVTEGRHE